MKKILQRAKENLTASKLDLGIFISCIIVAGLCITVLAILISRDLTMDNEVVFYETASPTDAPQTTQEITTMPETTTVQQDTTYTYDVMEDGSEVRQTELLQADITAGNSWSAKGDRYVQYNKVIRNISDHTISGWELVLNFDGTVYVSDSWGGVYTVYDDRILIEPVAYTQELQPGETKETGVILYADQYPDLVKYSIKTEGVSQCVSMEETTAVTVDEPENNVTENTENQGSSEEETTGQAAQDPQENQTTYTSGSLHVSGTNLYDSQGNIFQIRGVSTHGLSWFPEYVNSEAFASLKSYGVNTIRLALYTSEYNGYCTGGNKQELKDLVKKGVQIATEQGMYVVIDWHVLSEGNPNTYKDDAVKFFDEMSRTFANQTNVLYEICNEPNGGVEWSEIKSYAETVIDVIRNNDANAVIIVGTPTWSQDVDVVSQSPLGSRYSNIMYALHFYAATHKDSIREKLNTAYSRGLPVLVTEFSICDASGNGSLDKESAAEWMNLLNKDGIGYIAWNLSNKDESSSLLKSSCSKTGGFTADDFSQSGQWYFNQLP